jgi:preprotein translocase subunit SecA
MLRIIDTKWREHLYEMDYLQEGINLRAMGQRDPLTEWQREGYDMFGQMMKGIAQDLVRYVMHVQVQVNQPAAEGAAEGAAAAPAPVPQVDDGADTGVQNVQYSAPDDSASGGGTMAATAARSGGAATATAPEGAPAAAAAATMTPVVKNDWDKTPRNAPCPCGSGKKFKLCHGRA